MPKIQLPAQAVSIAADAPTFRPRQQFVSRSAPGKKRELQTTMSSSDSGDDLEEVGEGARRDSYLFLRILENSEDLVTDARGYTKIRKINVLRGFLYQAYDVSSNRQIVDLTTNLTWF